MVILIFLSAIFSVERANAFPEMIRHGYVNCTTCHVSPSGEGLLTAYGRSLSQELLSTWRREGESDFLYGLVTLPEWLHLGGDLRMVQTYRDTPTAREGRFIVMQADVEGAISYGQFQAAGTIGREQVSGAPSFADEIFSRRHYVNYRPTDQLSFRAGKFNKAYGITVPDHVLVIKRGLGWDTGSETYNVEAAWLGSDFDVFATGVIGRPDVPRLQRDKGFALRSSLNFLDRYKVGLSYFWGTNDNASRHVFGPFGILGITPHFFILFEIDFQRSAPANGSEPRFGIVDYIRVNYEVIQGLHLYVTQELSKLDFKNELSRMEAYGIGIQFFPRPHFEMNLFFQKQKILAVSSGLIDMAAAMFHFYL